jgi:hypothetical protein
VKRDVSRTVRTELPLDVLSPFQVAKHEGGMNPNDRNAGEKRKDRFHWYSFSSSVMSSAAVNMAHQIEGEGMMRIHSSSQLSIRRMLYGGKLAIDAQAFCANFFRGFGQPFIPQLHLRLPIHAFDGTADVGETSGVQRDARRCVPSRTLKAFCYGLSALCYCVRGEP